MDAISGGEEVRNGVGEVQGKPEAKISLLQALKLCLPIPCHLRPGCCWLTTCSSHRGPAMWGGHL